MKSFLLKLVLTNFVGVIKFVYLQEALKRQDYLFFLRIRNLKKKTRLRQNHNERQY